MTASRSRHRVAADAASQRGFVIERRAEKTYLGHVQYAVHRGEHLPVFVGSIGEVESWLSQPPLGEQQAT